MGEIGLATGELRRDVRPVRLYLAAEVFTFLLAAGGPLLGELPLPVCALPWALAPLLATASLRLADRAKGHLSLRELLPHFGSTAAVGMSTYVFRLSIALLTGKSIAGELFTAFAIGGLLPTLFGQGLAPTLAHRYRDTRWPLKWLLLPAAIVIAALSLAAIAGFHPRYFAWSGHSGFFWVAASLSVAGGIIMSFALFLRTKLIQEMRGGQVYGPDLIANLLIATCVPFVFYLLGAKALGGLYLLSAVLNYLFFWGAGRRQVAATGGPRLLIAIAVLLTVPLFSQLHGGLFSNPAFIYDAGANVNRVPLPLSIAAVFAGIALLGNYASAIRSLTTVFSARFSS